jgi:hypothetical protein
MSDELSLAAERLRATLPTDERRKQRWEEYLESEITAAWAVELYGKMPRDLPPEVLEAKRQDYDREFLSSVMPEDMLAVCAAVKVPTKITSALYVGSLKAKKTKADGSANRVAVLARDLRHLLEQFAKAG